MRNLIAAAALFAGLYLLVPGQASAAPPPLADHAVTSKAHAASLTEQVRAKQAGKQTYVRRKSVNKTVKLRRRYDWTYYPYWRPYQYRYWQYIYPYGGPLF